MQITHGPVAGALLRSDKGINLPESELRVPALTSKDIDDLAFVVRHSDMVALSFASGAKDVELLQEHMRAMGNRQPAIVLKIETRRGFDHLPEMLLAAMKMPCAGVMIARGASRSNTGSSVWPRFRKRFSGSVRPPTYP